MCHCHGPCQVLAGPGSGKTLVITEHIRFLLSECNIPPEAVLVITFSRAAAREMADRYRAADPENSRKIRFCTFHSLFLSIILEQSDAAPRILDEEERRAILQGIAAEISVPDKSKTDAAVSSGLSASEAEEQLYRVYKCYLRENNLIDYEAMITGCYSLLSGSPEICGIYRKRYTHILIDEFQDINKTQYETVKLLLGEGSSLFAVGDDDQCIYGFRGSQPEIMQQMLKDFPDCRRIILNVNYRCTEEINSSSLLLISENRKRIPKMSRAFRGKGSRPRIIGFESSEEQYRFIQDELNTIKSRKTAVIFRSNAQLTAFQKYIDPVGKSMDKVNNPIVRVGKELASAVYSYFAAALAIMSGKCPDDTLLIRIMNLPQRYLTRETLSMDTPGSRRFYHELAFLGGLSPARAWDYLMRSVGLQNCFGGAEADNAAAYLKKLAASSRTLKAASDILLKAAEDMDRPDSGFAAFQASLFPEGMIDGSSEEEALSANRLSLMTYHRSKGLEFDHVYLPDLNDGIIPSRRASGEASIEEERRLLYVGMTRAKDRLTLSYVRGTAENPRMRSRFLEVFDLPPDIEKRT